MSRAFPTAAPTRRRAALMAVLALVATLLASGLVTAAPSAAAAPLASVSISTLDPTVGTPGGRLHVTGTVLVGSSRLRNVEVALRLSRTRVNSRSELAGVAAGLTTGKDGDVIARQQVPGSLAPGQEMTFDLGAALDKLPQLTDFGVYVVGVEVTATHRDGVGQVAITRTFLPWVPTKHDFTPTGFAWLWPIVDAPARLSNGTFADDSLAGAMGPGGRIARLTEAGAQLGQSVKLSWAVDPDLLDSARAMAKGYTLADGTPGTGQQAADSWISALRAATSSSEVLALPYADPDLVALQRGGLSADIERARAVGSQVAADVLQRDVTSDVAWPVDGFAQRSTLGLLRRSGVNAVVLDGRAQPTRLELNYTPSGRADAATGSGRVTTLVADQGLTELLRRADQSPLLAAQRFLAETAMITAELPNTGSGRVILVAPPRRWNPPVEFLDRLVSGVSSAAWMAHSSLAEMRAAAPAEVERRAVRYPAAAKKSELPASYLSALKSLHTNIDIFSGTLADRANRSKIIPDLELGVLRLESSWWRRRDDRVNRHNLEQTQVADLLKSVRVQPGSYTFGSKSGKIPLTVANDTDYDVVVVLKLEPDARLRVKPHEPIRIGPNRKVQVNIDASAVASGTAEVTATLLNLDGAAINQPVQLHIRITQYGTVALIITLGAAGVLVLMGLVRLVRRARAARRAADEPDTDQIGIEPLDAEGDAPSLPPEHAEPTP
ncbi:MAG: DUF6049 family protein [Actinomycetes bacterium]